MDYVPFNSGEFNRWLIDRGDQTLRLNYDLLEEDIVIDAGGYLGEWSETISQKYRCTVHVIEPLSQLYRNLEQRFNGRSNFYLHNFAIGGSTRDLSITIEGDSSTMYGTSTNTETILCKDVKEFLQEESLDRIALFKINIEGGEYELLERMIELNLVNKVQNFQIQFHRFIPECKERREYIQKALSKTHTLTWNYDWIWENWQLKK